MPGDFSEDFDAVAAMESYLGVPDEPAAPEAPATQEAPATEIQPQTAPEAEQSTDGVITSEDAQAPAGTVTASPAVSEAKPQPVSSPELDQRLSEANRTAQEAAAARDQYVQRLNAVVPQLEAVVAGDFADIKTPEDVFRLMQADPNRYNSFVIANTRLNQARQAQQQASQEAQQSYRNTEQQKLVKALPDLADPEKGEALKVKLRAYAKAQGIPDTRQARDADEVIRLHREMVMHDELQAYKSKEAEKEAEQVAKLAEANKKAAKAPPVQQPGVQRDTNKDDKASTDFSRFQKSGRLDDLATALQNIM